MQKQNLFTPEDTSEREFTNTLLDRKHFRFERIVSMGHVTPAGEWYDQPWDEWVVLLRGRAHLLLEQGNEAIDMRPGDYVLIPAHCRHRVTWTDPGEPSVWLALHFDPAEELPTS